jgi:hypothetical protein
MGSPEARERLSESQKHPLGRAIKSIKDREPENELERPTPDAEKDRLIMNALISRLQSQAIRGAGVRANIRTSPLGVTESAALLKRGLKGA